MEIFETKFGMFTDDPSLEVSFLERKEMLIVYCKLLQDHAATQDKSINSLYVNIYLIVA